MNSIDKLLKKITKLDEPSAFIDKQISKTLNVAALPYTSDLTAAASLVPEGWSYMLMSHPVLDYNLAGIDPVQIQGVISVDPERIKLPEAHAEIFRVGKLKLSNNRTVIRDLYQRFTTAEGRALPELALIEVCLQAHLCIARGEEFKPATEYPGAQKIEENGATYSHSTV